MVVIARRSGTAGPVSLEKVSKTTRISRRYLEQLALALKSASLLRSVSGRKGGYALARPAEEIKIGQIIEAAIGPVNVVECVGQPEACLKSDFCECRLVYMLINKGIKEVLHAYSLADLADKKWLEKVSQDLLKGSFPEPGSTNGTPEAGTGGCPVS